MSEKQFSHKVVNTEGAYIASFENETQANFDAEDRSKRAEAMGLKTRYKVEALKSE